jgi:hypothetical protein
LVLFNPRNPHEISNDSGADGLGRLQMGSFIGRMPGGDLILWS